MIISVIVPIYNVEKYLPKCIESIINQTYKQIEIILVNDGSKDNCGEICDEYSKKDKRIKVIHQKNSGVSVARNNAINIASGKYIGFVDGDDYIELDMFEKLIKLIQANNCDMAICGYIMENEYGKIIKKSDDSNKNIILNKKEALKLLFSPKRYTSFPVDKLYKKELFSDIRYPSGKIYEDADTTYKLIHECQKVVYTPEPLYHYIRRNNSITLSKFSPAMMYRLEVDKNLSEFVKNNYPDLYPYVEHVWYRTNIQLILKMQRALYDNKEIFDEIANNIRKNIFYILKPKNKISKSNKLVALLVSISPIIFKYLTRCIMKFKKSENELYISKPKAVSTQ